MKNHTAKIGYTIFSLGMLLLLCFESNAQDSFSVKTADGYLYVQNTDDKSFTMDIRGKVVEPKTAGENPAFMIDGRPVQIVQVNIKDFVPVGKTPSEAETLEIHRDWEVAFLAGAYETKLTPISEKQTVAGHTALAWYFKRPKYNTEFDRDVFLTIIVGKHVVGLSSPLGLADKLDDGQATLIRILKTINISEKPFDPKKLSDQVRTGTVGTK